MMFLTNKQTQALTKGAARANVTTLVNNSLIREEERNGRKVIIVPSATLPDNIIMNGVRYPAEEIGKGYRSLENTHAPLGHPMRGNEFLEAASPSALPAHYCGAHNENVRRENGRVFIDKVIDVQVASQLETGRAVLNAIAEGQPIHTSTGLWCVLDDGDDEAQYTARDLTFDHDAILLNEDGAATPNDGVGMLVNGKKIQVINSALEDAERSLDWAIGDVLSSVERVKSATVIDQLKSKIMEVFGLSTTTTTEEVKTMSDEKLDALSEKLNALEASIVEISNSTSELISSAIKPIADQMNADAEKQKAANEAAKAKLVEKIVKANAMNEAVANTLTIEQAEAICNTLTDGQAAPLNTAGGNGKEDDEFEGYSLNSHIGGDK